MKDNKYFLFYGDITEGIFDSQVLYHLDMMQKNNYKFTLICFVPLKYIIARFMAIKTKCKQISIINHINSKYLVTFNPSKWHGRFINTIYSFLLGISIRVKHEKSETIIIHARGPHAANIGLKIKKYCKGCRVIFDMRSEGISELNYRHLKKDKYDLECKLMRSLHEVQKKVIAKCDISLMISDTLKKYVHEFYKYVPRIQYTIPSAGRSDLFYFNNKIRDEMRVTLGLNNKFVMGYSGSMNQWQKIDKLLNAFKYVSQKRKNVSFLILTNEKLQAEKIIDDYPDKSGIIIKNIKYEELGRYLLCFDMGLLLRDKLILNKVASPTKFAEYILCGVPVFISSGIGDLERTVNQNKLGICVDDFNDDIEFKKKLDMFLENIFNREGIAEYGKIHYCREAYMDIYKEIYS